MKFIIVSTAKKHFVRYKSSTFVRTRLLFIFRWSKKISFSYLSNLYKVVAYACNRCWRIPVWNDKRLNTPPPGGQCFTLIHCTFHANQMGGFVLALFSLRSRKQNGFRYTYHAPIPVQRVNTGKAGVHEQPSRRVHPDVRFNTYAVSDTGSKSDYDAFSVKRNARLEVVPYPMMARYDLRPMYTCV